MADLLLSICIPTYNRAECLDINVRSIVDQIILSKLEKIVEVVIVSNASTDNTDEVADQFVKSYSFIRYIKNVSNLGIDGNIYKCTVVAKGKYVHLLSDDDMIINNGIVKILNLISVNQDVDFFFLNVQNFVGEYGSPNLTRPIFDPTNDFICTDKNEFIESIWIYATFVSSFLLNKETWFKSANHENYIGTDIYLSYALFDHLSNSKSMMLVAEPIIASRDLYTGNYRVFYAFSYQWHKLLIDHAAHLHYDKHVMTRVFKKTIIKNLIPRVINLRVNGGEIDGDSWKYLFEPTKKYLISWFTLYPLVFMPLRLLKLLRRIKRTKGFWGQTKST